ncbi:S49 family peptidase, partial [Helicobacter ganmani]
FMRKWNPQEEAMLKDLVEEQYKMFVQEVTLARKISLQEEPNFAQGRILSANNALKFKLIDKIGSLYDAQELLFIKANIQNPKWHKEEKDKIEIYLEKIFGDNIALGVQNGIALALEQLSKIWLKGN